MITLSTRERIAFLLFFAGVLGVTLVFAWAEHVREERVLRVAHDTFHESHEALVVLRDLALANNVTAEINDRISDCAERPLFEERLSTLTSQKKTELTETESLYYRCRDYYVVRKEAMVAEMERVYAELATAKHIAASYRNDESLERLMVTWREVIGREKEKADLLREQMLLQGAVIDALKAQKSVSTLLARGSEVQELYGVAVVESKHASDRVDKAWADYTLP